MRTRLLTSCLALVAMTVPAAAWDDQGHMTVAAAAYDQLTAKAKARVAQLLALSAFPTKGTNNAKPADAAKAVFMLAATSPDAIKKEGGGFTDDGEDPTNATRAPSPSANAGFSDKFMHKYWHYIDIPFSPDHTPLEQPPAINVKERIGVFRKTLASNAPDELKAYDLVWLLHLVGDVHQPLHATSRFTKDAPHGDTGGNGVKLCSNCRDELHAFWDGIIGSNETISAAITAAHNLPKPNKTQAAKSDEDTWVQESFAAAKKSVYVSPIGIGSGPFTITAAYKANAKAVARQRIALAAARLANLLNTELK